MREDDKMPQQICHNCCNKLTSWCKFYDLCHTNQKRFKEQFKEKTAENSVESDIENDAEKENVAPSINDERHKRSTKSKNIFDKRFANTVIKEEINIFDKQLLEPIPPLSNEKQSSETLHLLSNKEQLLEPLHLLSNKEQLPEPLHSLSNKEQSPESLHSLSDDKEQLPLFKKPMVWVHCLKLSQNKSNVPKTLTSIQSDRLDNDNKFNESAKISDMITEEQKEAIETYYTKDQSIIKTHDEEVQENMIIKARNVIECKICFLTYSRRDKCEIHIWSHLNIKPFKCKKCNFATVTVSNIRCHIRKSHLKIKPFVCYICSKQYTTAVLLKEHINTHTGERPYKCGICKFSSTSRQILSNHMNKHKPSENVACKVCSKNFKSRVTLRVHMRNHDENYALCDICGARLSNEKNLEEHKKKMHTCDYNCDICSKTFKSKKTLSNHMNVHADPSYRCTKCPNVYKSKYILKEHILKHDGIRNYKCSICAKCFSQQSHLAAHKKVHSPPKYQCSHCHKKFNRCDNMKMHQKKCKNLINKEEKE